MGARTTFRLIAKPALSGIGDPKNTFLVSELKALLPTGTSRQVCLSGPLHFWGEAGQDRVHVPAGLQPEDGAAIVEQVELDIAATADQLLLAISFGPVLIEILAHDVIVDERKGAADFLGEA